MAARKTTKTNPKTPTPSCSGIPSNRRLWTVYRYSAHRRGIPWELTPEQFYTLTALPCFYCHRPPHLDCPRGGHVYTGLDRMDNSKGYQMDNVLPACQRCNGIKSNRLTASQMAVIARALGLMDVLS